MMNIGVPYKMKENPLILIFGGLALFLFALDLLKGNLKALYTQRLYQFIQKSTNTKLKAYLIGIVTTILIQSSSGVTAIVLSLLSAGYLSLPAALGIMIGSNIGTCASAFLVSLELESYSLYLILISFIFYMFTKKEKKKMVTCIFLNLGIVFLGLQFMGLGFHQLSQSKTFMTFLKVYNQSTVLSILFGTFLTAIIQSSSATIGVLEQLYAAKVLSLKCAIGIMLGSNIGTTITGYLATFHTTKEAKQAVSANVLFNMLGVLLFFIVIQPYTGVMLKIEKEVCMNNVKLTIAFSHLIFNVVTALLAYVGFDLLLRMVHFKMNPQQAVDNS